MKILLIGKSGQLGSSILSENTSNVIFAPDRVDLDVENLSSFEVALNDIKPDVVINTAAFHNVPICEIEPHRAFDINVIAVRNLALACKKANALFVTFSTDYVFGGEKNTPYIESDCPKPLQMYGISRLAGELAVMSAALENSIIIRTCGLYGLSGAASKGGNFVDKRILDAETNTLIEMGCDQVVSPTFSKDLAVAVLRLIQHPELKAGIYHLVNEGECTWYEFTKAIYELSGLSVKVTPVDRGGMSGSMRRPLYSVLANTKALTLGVTLPHWRDALSRFLKEKYEVS
ncbi:dTDP-4-dehydrorhamnose reductase [Methylotenera sp.]|uniref:dTDP-4-dehydrorhamnose reductase n=1 Tax=Methylotenera sp. TaxID=2051956 RepID=UPI0024876A69|nr:dTDP-4-dehydrorhamnose reductase [Methylotenera sp.]MDI1299686.1 dTDP-4-dehydrorhamnose reductase [Methylotenera sp.]